MQHWGIPLKEHPTDFAGRAVISLFIPDGSAGVFIFFVLSGFLITQIILQARVENEAANRLWAAKNFMVRRALRIFPIYYLMIFILYCCFADIKQYLPYLLTYTLNMEMFRQNQFLSMFAHSWTLCVEEQFYLVWPWLVLFLNKRYLGGLMVISIAIGVASTVLTMGFLHHIGPTLVFNCLDAFGMGGLYAYARLNPERCSKFERLVKKIAPFFLCIYIFWKVMPLYHLPEYGICLSKTVGSVLALWLIILSVNAKEGWIKRHILENRFLNFMGKISYGVYIFHPYMYYMNGYIKAFIDDRIVHAPFWHDFFTDYYFFYIFNFVVLILLCWLSYTLIEKPFLNLKRLFSYKHATSA